MERLIFWLIAVLAAATATAAERRVALVVANARYAAVEPLANPANDARLVADSLTKAGFTVDRRDNLDAAHFRQALRDFRGQADGADIALIYYAGHGIEDEGQNYLMPVDVEVGRARDLQYDGIGLDLLMTTLGGARMRVAVLDACRNSPFASEGVIKATGGLAGVEVDDVLVIFAAAPGEAALDGAGSNSPFATALARRLTQAGLALQLLGGTVRDDVIAATGRKQRPFISASVTGNPVYLVAGSEQGGAMAAVPPPPPSAPAPAGPSERWVVRAPRLPIAEVNVERTEIGDSYSYAVSGTYPRVRRDGTAAPQARLIRIVPRHIGTGRAIPISQARQSKVGLWNPGDPFAATFRYPKANIDRMTDVEVRLCIGEGTQGDSGFCFWSPNLVKDGPQQLLPSGPGPRRPGIAPRRAAD